MHPRQIQIADYDYPLPEDRIAGYPLPERDASRLLIYQQGELRETLYRNIAEEIPLGATLVFNNTRVLDARLLFTKDSGGVIEIFTLEPAGHYADMETALSQRGSVEWNCLVGGASKWKPGYRPKKIISRESEPLVLEADILERLPDAFRIRFTWTPASLSFPEVMHLAGQIPLPPYIKRKPEEADTERYQTVYAAREGSVAAPTAGLHFTTAVFDSLDARQIQRWFVTLHVGAGTFRPVNSLELSGHEMHSEYIEADRQTLERLAGLQGPLYAVGTTSLRTLESLYWMGVRCMQQPGVAPEALAVGQWDPYDDASTNISREASLNYLLKWLTENNRDRVISRTRILIAPGYRFRMVDGLVTNFHQPRSTLLLLIAAMAGDAWKTIYQYALDHAFRFLSYGDGCLLQAERSNR